MDLGFLDDSSSLSCPRARTLCLRNKKTLLNSLARYFSFSHPLIPLIPFILSISLFSCTLSFSSSLPLTLFYSLLSPSHFAKHKTGPNLEETSFRMQKGLRSVFKTLDPKKYEDDLFEMISRISYSVGTTVVFGEGFCSEENYEKAINLFIFSILFPCLFSFPPLLFSSLYFPSPFLSFSIPSCPSSFLFF